MKIRVRIIALTLGCIILMAGSGCSDSIEQTDALDPMGYAAAGYYGKSSEELKKLLPEIEDSGEPIMILESSLSKTVSCKQVFCFYNNELIEIQYHYLFDIGEEAERLFVEQCKRIFQFNENASSSISLGEYPLNLEEFLEGSMSPIQEDGTFWKTIIESDYADMYEAGGVEIIRALDDGKNIKKETETLPLGWKDKYDIQIEGMFCHWKSDPDGTLQRGKAEFLDGKEARIILTIATWN